MHFVTNSRLDTNKALPATYLLTHLLLSRISNTIVTQLTLERLGRKVVLELTFKVLNCEIISL